MNKLDTDCFRFSEQEIFKIIRDALPDDTNFTQNILECQDDVLFVWNSSDCCLLTLNWKSAKIKDDGSVKYQTLVPSSPQNYTVESITASHEGTFLALTGARGVSVLELPKRWGPNGQYHEEKSKIMCSSHNLDERFFANNNHLEVLQVRWHSATPSDSLLLVLLSNNSIRVYDETTLRHVWRVGPIPCALPPTGTHLPNLNSLGDTAVDFDIAPPRVVSSNDDAKDVSSFFNESYASTRSNRVEWPLVVLRGNGNLYIVLVGVDTEKPHIQGPLSMFPARNDNYGNDYCSILVLPSVPPTIVIAESTGKLHHALLMENEEVTESFNKIDASLIIYPSEWIVNVLETVVLELGLAENENKKHYTCTLYLKRDLINESRYFTYHNTGLHAITIGFIRELYNFMESEENNIENTNFLSSPSHAEYLICTKALDSNKINPVIGFTICQSPTGLLVLLGSGQVVSLSLIPDSRILREAMSITVSAINKQSNPLPLTKIFSESFETFIKNILSTEVSHPILKLDKSTEPTPKESLELLMNATQVLREQYFIRYDKAKQEIQKRVKVLHLLKEQQQQEIAQLQIEKDKIRANAERLAELYEDICDKQQVLFKRAQEVLRFATINSPHAAMVEKDFKLQINQINAATKTLMNNIGMAKKKIQYQENQVHQLNVGNKTTKIVLQQKLENTIKDLISELTVDINRQIKEIKNFKTVLNLP